MNLTLIAVVHEAEEGGFWAEIPSLPGCYSQGETWDEVTSNIKEAAECHLFDDSAEGEVLADWVKEDLELYSAIAGGHQQQISREVHRLTEAMLDGLKPAGRQLAEISL